MECWKTIKCFLPTLLSLFLAQLSVIEKESVGTGNADMESRQKKKKVYIYLMNK